MVCGEVAGRHVPMGGPVMRNNGPVPGMIV